MYIKVGGPVFQTSKRRGERTMEEWSICSGCFFLTGYGANILTLTHHSLRHSTTVHCHLHESRSSHLVYSLQSPQCLGQPRHMLFLTLHKLPLG